MGRGTKTRALDGTGTSTPRRRRFLLALLAIPLLCGSFGSFVAPIGRVAGDELGDAKAKQAALERHIAEQKKQVEELNQAQDELRGEIAETNGALDQINADLTAVRASIDGMVVEIARVQGQYDGLVAEVAALDEQLVELEAQEIAKADELRERKALLGDRLRAAYDTDRVTLLEIFLSGGSFADVLAEVSYHLDVGEQDRALADQIKKDAETLEALHATVESTRTETNLLRQETAVQKKELDKQLRQLEAAQRRLKELEAETARQLEIQTEAFEELASTRDNIEEAIARASRAQRQLAGKIKELIEEQKRLGSIPSQYNGTLEWPLIGRISGEYGCSTYPGYAPGNGCEHYHNGIDVVTRCDDEIKAAADGTVAYVGWNWADGPDPAWVVVILHSESLQTWYAHLAPTAPGGLAPGTKVKTGDVIGYEGSTGHSTGCHLHWMVMKDGRPQNPRLFL